MKYENLWLCSLDREQHDRTCGYWWTVTAASTPHTAFRTLSALYRWIERRGLMLTAELPPQGVHSSQKLSGAYVDRMHGDPADMPKNWIVPPFLKMSNGQYTQAVATVDETGLRTVHYLGPNAPRPVFDHNLARAHEDAGLPGLPGAWSPHAAHLGIA